MQDSREDAQRTKHDNAKEKSVSKSSATATVTPEEQWTLIPEADTDAPEPANPKGDVKNDDSEIPDEKAFDEKDETAGAETSEAENAASDGKDDGNDPPARRWWSRPRVRRVGVFLLIVIAVAAIAGVAVLGWKMKQQSAIDSAADEAERTAQSYAVALTSVSSDHLDQNFADVLNGATGEFKDMYSQSSGQLRQLLVDNKATAQGKVIDSGVKSASTSKVEVLLFVDQTVTNTATPDPRVDRSRVVMTMEKTDGRWLASKVDLP